MGILERAAKMAATIGGKIENGVPYDGGTAYLVIMEPGKYFGPPIYVIERRGSLTMEQKANIIRAPSK